MHPNRRLIRLRQRLRRGKSSRTDVPPGPSAIHGAKGEWIASGVTREIAVQAEVPIRLLFIGICDLLGSELNIMPTKIESKTRELCQTIVDQPEMISIRKRIDTFLSDSGARGQYETVMSKGQALQEKQSRSQPLESAEIADFEKHRDALMNNAIARGFLDAQEELHAMQHSIHKTISKTIELGRVPTEADLADGSCGAGCGCHH
jgi:cell fate (sporulation/competence/biofilm development) regulator YlbF (YheA/YmcA/DUF963 family)